MVDNSKVYPVRFDPSRLGLSKFLSEIEEYILRYIWSIGEYGADSSSVLRVVLDHLPNGETISRATVIHHLNRMVEVGILEARQATGKGGRRKIYYTRFDERGLTTLVMRTMVKSMMEDFPEETWEVINELVRDRMEKGLQAKNVELEATTLKLGLTREELQLSNEELLSANEELQSSNEELTTLSNDLSNIINSTNLPIIIVDIDLVIRDITPQAEERFNLISSNVGRPIRNINLGIDVDDIGRLIFDVISSGEMRELEVLDSESRWYTMLIRPYLVEGNEIDGATIMFVDITEHKRMEEELKDSEERFRSLFESTLDGIIISDREGKILNVNQAAAEITGFNKPEELMGKPVLELYVKPEQREKLLEKLMTQGSLENVEIGMLRKDGNRRQVLVSITLHKDKEGKILRTDCIFRDITEQRKIEEALKISEAMYRNLWEESHDGRVLIDQNDGRIMDANAEFTRQTGRNRNDLLQMKIWDMGPPFIREAAERKFYEIKSSGGNSSFEFVFQKPSGEFVNIDFASRCTRIGEKEVLESRSRDITERKVIEKELKESEERYRSLVEESPFAISVSADGALIFVNDKRTELTGHTKTVLMEGKGLDFVFPDDRKWMQDRIRARDQGEEVPATWEFRLVRKDGTVIHVVDHQEHIKWSGVDAIMHILEDITERKKMEDALKASEDRWRTLVENAPVGIITLDLKGTITSINPAFSIHTGHTKDEIIGKHFTKVPSLRVKDIPKYVKMFAGVVKSGVLPVTEFYYRRKDGSEGKGVAQAGMVTFEGGKREILLVLREISERKQLEEKIRLQS